MASLSSNPPWSLPTAIICSYLAEQDCRVGAAESKRIGNCDFQIRLACFIRDIIQVALGVRLRIVNSRWHDSARDGQQRENRFDTTGCAEKVPSCDGHPQSDRSRAPRRKSSLHVFSPTHILRGQRSRNLLP